MTTRQAVLIFVKGFLMGAADVVPGVSGGTIAFITGIYERLIGAISHFDQHLLSHIVTRQWLQAWRHSDGLFLLILFAGIGSSVFSLAYVISYLLASQPLLVWSFFVGLVLASGVLLLKDIGRLHLSTGLWLLAGIVVALAINQLRPVVVEPTLGYVFVCGMIAICAMLLPGISGSFLLLVLGVYSFILDAVKSLDLAVVVVFMLGAGIGILGFAKLLAFALARARKQVFATLTGFLLGSIAMIWPWKITEEGSVSINVSPMHYAQYYELPAQFLLCICCFAVGLLLVLALSLLKKP